MLTASSEARNETSTFSFFAAASLASRSFVRSDLERTNDVGIVSSCYVLQQQGIYEPRLLRSIPSGFLIKLWPARRENVKQVGSEHVKRERREGEREREKREREREREREGPGGTRNMEKSCKSLEEKCKLFAQTPRWLLPLSFFS